MSWAHAGAPQTTFVIKRLNEKSDPDWWPDQIPFRLTSMSLRPKSQHRINISEPQLSTI